VQRRAKLALGAAALLGYGVALAFGMVTTFFVSGAHPSLAAQLDEARSRLAPRFWLGEAAFLAWWGAVGIVAFRAGMRNPGRALLFSALLVPFAFLASVPLLDAADLGGEAIFAFVTLLVLGPIFQWYFLLSAPLTLLFAMLAPPVAGAIWAKLHPEDVPTSRPWRREGIPPGLP
jgi:hypothetical protein